MMIRFVFVIWIVPWEGNGGNGGNGGSGGSGSSKLLLLLTLLAVSCCYGNVVIFSRLLLVFIMVAMVTTFSSF